MQTAGPLPCAPHSGGLGCGPKIGISNKFQVMLLLVQGPHFEKHCSKVCPMPVPVKFFAPVKHLLALLVSHDLTPWP